MPLVTSDVEAVKVAVEISGLREHESVAIDTETTGTELYLGDEIRGLSLAYRDRSWYVPISHPDSFNVRPLVAHQIGRSLSRTAASSEYHNALFDWKSLEAIGVEPPERFWDTQVVSWLMDENTTHTLKGLGAMIWGEDEKAEQLALKELFKGTSTKEMYTRLREEGWPVQAARLESKELAQASRKTWATLTAEDIGDYAEKDAVLTHRLTEWQRYELEHPRKTDVRPAVQPMLDYQHVIYRMIQRGVLVDVEKVRLNRQRSLERMWEIEPMFEGVNLNSPKQLVELIYGEWGLPVGHRTPTGNPSTNREALEEMAGAHPSLDQLLEYRKLAKRVGTYYDNLLRGADSDGRVHTGYCTTCTVTGRLSSRNPNLMNLPRDDTDPEVKTVFISPPGKVLVEFDLKSAELFVGASIARDSDMMGALTEEGRDFHTETAVAIFGNTDGNHRTLAKNMNYGIPYGIGPSKFATYLIKGTGRPMRMCEYHGGFGRSGPQCDPCQAKRLIAKHRMAWPRTHLAIDRLTAYARQEGYIPLSKEGRFRHFRSPGRIVPYYTAFNAVVQGGVALVMQDVMMGVEQPAAELGAEMVLQVHDSLWFYIEPGTQPLVMDLLQRVLDEVNPFVARLTWDAKSH